MLSNPFFCPQIQVNKLKQIAYENPEQMIELGPVSETLPLPMSASDVFSLTQAGCSELQNPHLSASREGDTDSGSFSYCN